MKKKYHTVGTFKNPIEKSVKGEKLISVKHKYMTAHFPGLVHTLQYKVAELSMFCWPNDYNKLKPKAKEKYIEVDKRF